ncbi:MAG TPA: hypothetical protein PK158_10525 [Spirochaetota bacterium]|nr:hypothetical protein [Spirochaetota bacterium]
MGLIKSPSFVKIKIFIIFVILIMIAASPANFFAAWQHSDATDFEKKLADFKYGLYPEIENLEYTGISSLTCLEDENNSLNKKCAEFVRQNSNNIYEYRCFLLNNYKNSFPVNDLYEETGFKDFSIHQDYLKYKNKPAFTFLLINPFYEMHYFSNYYLANMRGASKLSQLYLQQQIGGERIFTRIKKGKIYEVMIDQYFFRFIFEFDASNSEMKLLKIFKKKNQIRANSE